jgi:hypothetical protein
MDKRTGVRSPPERHKREAPQEKHLRACTCFPERIWQLIEVFSISLLRVVGLWLRLVRYTTVVQIVPGAV